MLAARPGKISRRVPSVEIAGEDTRGGASSWAARSTSGSTRTVGGTSVADVEAEEKTSAEFERTLRNLWHAWLAEYDADGSGTISYEELKAFASLPVVPERGWIHEESARGPRALKNGDLEAEYTRGRRGRLRRVGIREFAPCSPDE